MPDSFRNEVAIMFPIPLNSRGRPRHRETLRKTVTAALDDESRAALDALTVDGTSLSAAVRTAIIEAAARIPERPLPPEGLRHLPYAQAMALHRITTQTVAVAPTLTSSQADILRRALSGHPAADEIGARTADGIGVTVELARGSTWQLETVTNERIVIRLTRTPKWLRREPEASVDKESDFNIDYGRWQPYFALYAATEAGERDESRYRESLNGWPTWLVTIGQAVRIYSNSRDSWLSSKIRSVRTLAPDEVPRQRRRSA